MHCNIKATHLTKCENENEDEKNKSEEEEEKKEMNSRGKFLVLWSPAQCVFYATIYSDPLSFFPLFFAYILSNLIILITVFTICV